MKQVRDVMTRQVCTIDAADTLADAAKQMRVYEVGALPVRDGVRIIGMLTDRDIVTRAVSFNRIPSAGAPRGASSAGSACGLKNRCARAARAVPRHAAVAGTRRLQV